MNRDLGRNSDWQLKVNINKTKCVIIINDGKGKNSDVIDDIHIEVVSKIKYLDVMIDDKLAFKSHLDYTSCKMYNKNN